jgi:hypothetical protein
MYFAPGATHAPHHVPPEWIEKYEGKFAHGWDRQREITFERQKELGVIPQDAVLTPRHAEIPAWDDMDPALKPVLERERFVQLILHALKSAGCQHTVLADSGMELLRQASKGLPRQAGRILCTAMRLAVPKGLNHLPDELVQQAIEELQ